MVVEHVSNSSYLAYLPREQMDPIDARKGPINDKKVHTAIPVRNGTLTK